MVKVGEADALIESDRGIALLYSLVQVFVVLSLNSELLLLNIANQLVFGDLLYERLVLDVDHHGYLPTEHNIFDHLLFLCC